MSNCYTPIYIKIPFLSPLGDITLQRDESSPNSPSCGYYENFTGSEDYSNYDYYEVDIQYDSGSGHWTFSGNSTGFNDPTIYTSVQKNNPRSPIGSYTGGIYDVFVEEYKQYDIYEFDYSFDKSTNVGSGVHLNRDVTFKFNISDYNSRLLLAEEEMARSPRLQAIVYDIIDENGAEVKKNFFSGYASRIKITEKDNIEIFGEYQPNFGVKATAIDYLLGESSTSKIFTYGNRMYIDSISSSDGNGTKIWRDSVTGSYEANSYEDGKLREDLKVDISFNNNTQYVNGASLEIYASTGQNFELKSSNKILSENLNPDSKFKSLILEDAKYIEPNKDYYFAAVASSAIGTGNAVRFGPQRIKKLEEVEEGLSTTEITIGLGDSSQKTVCKQGNITGTIVSGSGVIDTLIINKENYGTSVDVYEEEKYLYTTIPTSYSGRWIYTNFDYSVQFKNSLDAYDTVSKNIKLNATGTSNDPFNSGMPLFDLVDYNTGQAVELSVIYQPSGFYLTSNTGHSYNIFKYSKTSF